MKHTLESLLDLASTDEGKQQLLREALATGLVAWEMWANHWRMSPAYGCGVPENHPTQQAEIDKIKRAISLLTPGAVTVKKPLGFMSDMSAMNNLLGTVIRFLAAEGTISVHVNELDSAARRAGMEWATRAEMLEWLTYRSGSVAEVSASDPAVFVFTIPGSQPRLGSAVEAVGDTVARLRARLRESLAENERLRMLLTEQTMRADEAKRRLLIYQDRDEAVEIARLHGVIHRLKAELRGEPCPPEWLAEQAPTPTELARRADGRPSQWEHRDTCEAWAGLVCNCGLASRA